MSDIQNMGNQNYIPFRNKQSKLAEIIGSSNEVIKKLNMTQYSQNLSALQKKVSNDTFKIQLVGDFSNGKSTFINSFLGQDILPAYMLPCTAVINEVKYGEHPKAVLHFRNPLPEVLPENIPDKALAHMEKYNMKDIPPLEIPYNEISNYAVIPFGEDVEESLRESPYKHIELFWPMELLKNGVEIIDSPGLNDAETRTELTMDYLTKADAIIFLLRSDHLCSSVEMDFIENNLKGNGFENPFFVINRWDLVPEFEKSRMKTVAHSKLKDYTTLGENGLFYVSALKALEGKTSKNKEKYLSSGMPLFEKKLSEFLTKEKGNVKLSQPAKEVKRILRTEALDKIIPQQMTMLDSSLDDLKKKYEDIKPKLNDLQVKKQNLSERLALKIKMVTPEIQKCITQNITTMVDSIPVWCKECNTSVKPGIIPNKAKSQAAAKEIVVHVNSQIEKSQNEWKNKTLAPLIEEKIQEIFGSVENDIEKFFEEIDNIKVEVSGQCNVEENKVPTWRRVLGVAGGLALGDIPLALSGGLNGIGKEFAATFALEVGAGFVLATLGIFNPITLLGTIAGIIMYNVGKNKDSALSSIKESVASQMIKNISETKDEIMNNVTASANEYFTKFSDTITSAVDIEINEVNNQIQEVIKEMEKGQTNVDAKKAELIECESRIKELISDTDDFILTLIG